MKKRLPVILVIVAVIAVALIFIFTRHTHTFAEATCITAKICECGETEGEPLGHTWVDATCTTAKTCSVCNLVEGTPLGHTWKDATTDTPKTCELCGLTEGEPLPAKQGTVEGYEATEETEETELLTGAEIDIDNIEYEDISLPEEVSQITRGISNYAGTTSKHGYKYPADYVENSGNSVADTERMFDEGFFSEEEYQEMIEFARELDSGSFEQSIQDEANSDNSNSGGTVPGNGGVTVTIDKSNHYEPDGRICY